MDNQDRPYVGIDTVNEMDEKRLGKLKSAGIDQEEVLDQAREHQNMWKGYFEDNIVRGRDDLIFAVRDQWSTVERNEFRRLRVPCLTVNKSYDTVKKIIAEYRKNKQDLLVRSLTGKSSQEQIDLRADLVRTICYTSQNDLIYQNVLTNQLLQGYGAFEIDVDFENPYSFKKTVVYKLIPDQSMTTFDPRAKLPHKGDGESCSRLYYYGKEEFGYTFPHIVNPVNYSNPNSLLNFGLADKDTVVVCKYYVKEWFNFKLLQLSDGRAVTEDEWEKMQEKYAVMKELGSESQVVGNIIFNQMPKVVGDRQSSDYKIRQYLLTQNVIIDFVDWPSKYLPIIFADSDSHIIDGKQFTKSFIAEVKDAQRFVNYNFSQIANDIKTRRRERWIGTAKNVEGRKDVWNNPEEQQGILLANIDPITGKLPDRFGPDEISQTLLMAYQQGNQDIREIMGFSEMFEMQAKDISGKARRERKLESAMSSYIFVDNLKQAIAQGGRVVNDLLPYIVGDDERTMVVRQKDGKTKVIDLNRKSKDGRVQNALEQDDYDVEIDTGPSFAVQKEIALEFLQQTIAADPQRILPLVADLWAKNLDVQFMPQIADRLKTMVPPQIIAKEEGKPIPPQPPSPEEMMMRQEMRLKEQEIKDKEDELVIRQEKRELEKLKIALQAKQMQVDAREKSMDRRVDLHKANLDHHIDIASILADLHKSEQQTKNKDMKEDKNGN